MAVQSLYLPEAPDDWGFDIVPRHELGDCNRLLDDFAGLSAFYHKNGYLFFRQVINQDAIAEARDAMLAVAAKYGIVEPGDPTARWTGKVLAQNIEEESLEFWGIARRLIEHPDTQAFLAKVLGEPACLVPMMQYRIYPPGAHTTVIHQDGFYSPGIEDYRPVWMPLVPIPRAVGGVKLAVGQHTRGYFHNLAKPSPFPLVAGQIDPDSWATTDYAPGDVLIVHHSAPHGSLANTSDKVRMSIDTRVQSAARPTAFFGKVKAFTADTLTLATEREGDVTLTVGEDTFIRVLHAGIRQDFSKFAQEMKLGLSVTAVSDGSHAIMLRKGAGG